MSWSELAQAANKLCVETFADDDPITYTHESRSPAVSEDITAAFSAASERTVIDAGIPVIVSQPTLRVHLADLSHRPRQGDTVVRESLIYRVEEYDVDGEGAGMTLYLRLATP